MNEIVRTAATKQSLIEWLNEVPNDAQIGIELGQFGNLTLVAGDADSDQWMYALTMPKIELPELPDVY